MREGQLAYVQGPSADGQSKPLAAAVAVSVSIPVAVVVSIIAVAASESVVSVTIVAGSAHAQVSFHLRADIAKCRIDGTGEGAGTRGRAKSNHEEDHGVLDQILRRLVAPQKQNFGNHFDLVCNASASVSKNKVSTNDLSVLTVQFPYQSF